MSSEIQNTSYRQCTTRHNPPQERMNKRIFSALVQLINNRNNSYIVERDIIVHYIEKPIKPFNPHTKRIGDGL